MATASAIKDGLITNLAAASVFGSGQVSTNYSVMESTSACCAIVNLVGYTGDAMTLGNDRDEVYEFLIEAKVKDRGDPTTLMNDIYTMVDNVKASLRSDDTVQGTAKAINTVTAERDPTAAQVVGGQTWLPVDFLVEVHAWDN